MPGGLWITMEGSEPDSGMVAYARDLIARLSASLRQRISAGKPDS